MLLVLFAVVLLVPAFHVEGERHRRSRPDPCYSRLYGAGDIWCRLNGYGGVQGFDYSWCYVRCKHGPNNLRLPETVCRSDSPPCKKGDEDGVYKWKQDLDKRKADLLEAWCYCPKCY